MRPRKQIPAWAKNERASDVAWIMENQHIFWRHAQRQYRQSGRGAIVVYTLSHPPDAGNPFTYLTQAEVIEKCDEGCPKNGKRIPA